jgi:RNA polymerase sigma-70 factor (ECF subfamily)
MTPHRRVGALRDERTLGAELPGSLVTAARHGDTAAFALLVDARVDGLFRTAAAILGNEADARDATQEAFLSAWVNLPALRDADRFDAWLHRVLINQCRDMLRRRGRVREISLDEAIDTTPIQAPDRSGISAVSSAFDHLTVGAREILVLHHLHDLSVAEVAKRLRIPVGTAKWRLFRARRALERQLEAER